MIADLRADPPSRVPACGRDAGYSPYAGMELIQQLALAVTPFAAGFLDVLDQERPQVLLGF